VWVCCFIQGLGSFWVCTAWGSACTLNVEGFPGCAACRSIFRFRVQGLFVHCTVCAACGSGLRVEGFRFGFRMCGLWVLFLINGLGLLFSLTY